MLTSAFFEAVRPKMRPNLILIALIWGLGSTAAAQTPRTPSADGARVYIQAPADGATVSPTFTVRFGLQGMGVAPAGVDHPNTGHHHLLIDTAEPPTLAAPLPATDKILHFGKGQTETEITLTPGEHTLLLVLGDYLHIPHEPPLISELITVQVAGPEPAGDQEEME